MFVPFRPSGPLAGDHQKPVVRMNVISSFRGIQKQGFGCGAN
jgi:hypothetical protein